MCKTKLIRFIPVSLFLCLCLFGTISAQQAKNEFLPKYPVKSAVIQYNLKSNVGKPGMYKLPQQQVLPPTQQPNGN